MSLSSSQVQQAIAYAKQRYDVRSTRIIQVSFGTEADGDFGAQTAQAIAEEPLNFYSILGADSESE